MRLRPAVRSGVVAACAGFLTRPCCVLPATLSFAGVGMTEDRDTAFDGTSKVENPHQERTRIRVPLVTLDVRLTDRFGVQAAATIPDVTRTAVIPTDALVTALQQQGATVRRGDILPNAMPCFSVSGQVVFVNTGSLNAFEYPSASAAESDAAKISPTGSGVTGNGCAALITWVGPPHFYKRDQLIVVYAGSADDILRPLEAVLGKPFASR